MAVLGETLNQARLPVFRVGGAQAAAAAEKRGAAEGGATRGERGGGDLPAVRAARAGARSYTGSRRDPAGGDHQVGQAEEGVEWVAVFRQAAIPRFSEPKEVSCSSRHPARSTLFPVPTQIQSFGHCALAPA